MAKKYQSRNNSTENPKSKIQNLRLISLYRCFQPTTWLGHVLEEHPQICLSEPKEINFFNDIKPFGTQLKQNFHHGIKWYRKFYNHYKRGQLKGEITNYYGIDPLAAQRIYQHNPQIKILICLRQPVERIRSHYLFAKYFERKENRSFEQAIKEESQYIRMSKYHQTISLYLKHFPNEQIFIIWFEDIYLRPDELVREIFSFLGVDPSFKPKSIYKKSNPARASRSGFLQKITRQTKRALINLGFSGLVKKLKWLVLRLCHKANSRPLKTPIPEDVKQYIIRELTEDVHQMEKLTGKD